MRKKGKSFVQKIALERIYRLFELAEKEFKEHSERSNRYVELARKISARNNVSIPRELKRKFCKKCGCFLKEGMNCKIRVTKNYVVITCNKCSSTKKIGVK